MPDYTLPKNNTTLPNQQSQQQPPQQTLSAISQLSAASQQLKMETENALLREALATSAQNCEALMKQLAESQAEFQRQMMDAVTLSHEAYMGISHDLRLWVRMTTGGFDIFRFLGRTFQIAFHILLALWVYADSKKHERNKILWSVLTLFTSVIGYVLYLIVRESKGRMRQKTNEA